MNKKKTSSITVLSVDEAKAKGWYAEKTEHWNAFAKVRKDLFGFIDILCLDPINKKIIGIQATSYSNMSAREEKILNSPIYQLVKDCGIEIQVWGWKKKEIKGTKRKEWILKTKIL